MAAVALSASPALAAVTPTERHKGDAAVSYPLLALRAASSTVRPSGHYSHVSHVSHSSHVSHYSSSHSSHGSHYSHYSSSPEHATGLADPERRPIVGVAGPAPRRQEEETPSEVACLGIAKPLAESVPQPVTYAKRSQRIADHQPSPAGDTSSNNDGAGAAGAVVAVAAVSGVAVYVVRRRRRAG